jgi:hypothetical protein
MGRTWTGQCVRPSLVERDEQLSMAGPLGRGKGRTGEEGPTAAASTVQNAGDLLTVRTGPRPVTVWQPVSWIVTTGRTRPATVNLSR